MAEKQIGKHREKHPLKFNQITAYSSFTQVLGMKPEDIDKLKETKVVIGL